ncbi:uncharacterized protein LOC114249412 [Bombyx mandarina]|uniref:Uncharacterized protein LOC114249412 n=1 Tax=Bombyx mandarina TaxID=7092 RepID=A0A6J2KCX9_BOMMA|nr:uncharacterized protein LOC114249412 [Bombyx mandarina]
MNIPNKTTNSKTKVNDFHTLNLILNGNIDVADYNLTQTEKTQVDYIKMNTQLFVKSVGKFAKILQDIIVIVRRNKQQPTETNQAIVKPRNNVINDRYKKNKDDNMFDAFKGLLRAYDLIHNSFVKKMYKIIKTIENVNKKQSVKRKLSTFDNLPRVQNVNKTSNISEILEKLTSLEGRIKLRSKRDVRRDDAVEYLLTVMEFLLKQNYRLDSNPADDGIDLLLDAIRNTPDIKTTKKKVLEDVSIGTNAFPNSVKLDKLTEDSVLKSETDSKYVESEEKKTIVSTTDNVEASEDDDDRDYDDKYVFNRRVKKVKNDTKIASSTENIIHTTDSIRLNPDSSKLQMINFEISNNDDQKYDVYIADKDVIFNTFTEITTSDQGIRKAASDDEIIDATQSINMSKLDWFGDNDKEIREVRSEKNKIESSTSTDTPVSTRSTKIVEDNISGITKEIKEEEKKTKSIEQIMVKKQMELLNSLDYETERILTDTSESKDEEKYSEINSYFV